MGKDYNPRKTAQLGMSASKATYILLRQTLFAVAIKAGMDTCYRCGCRIENVAEFTIEHKMPWMYSDDPARHYFDQDNIAFSHTRCNREASRCKYVVKAKSGFKGVYQNGKNSWRAVVSVNGKNQTIGVFPTAIEAAIAYDQAAIIQFGERATTNEKLGLLVQERSVG